MTSLLGVAEASIGSAIVDAYWLERGLHDAALFSHSDEDFMPALSTVRIVCREAQLRLQATDRHRLIDVAVDLHLPAPHEPAAEEWEALVPSRGVQLIRRLLMASGRLRPNRHFVNLAVVGRQLAVKSAVADLAVRIEEGTFPNCDSLIADARALEPALVPHYGINPSFLAAFKKMRSVDDGQPVVMWAVAHGKPVLFDYGPRVAGLIMPIRLTSDWTPSWKK